MGFKAYIIKYISLCFLLFSVVSLAQNDLKERKNQFGAQLKKEIYPYLHAQVYKEGKQFLDSYSRKSKPELDKKVMNLFTEIRKVHLSVSEDYLYYFKILNAYYSGALSLDKTIQFIKLNGQLLQYNRISESKKIIKNVSNFLKDGMLYRSSHHKWTAKRYKWEFDFEYEPLIIFSKLDLVCEDNTRTFKIANTSGKVNLLNNIFSGSDGTVKWPKHRRKAELETFEIPLNEVYFSAKNAKLTDNSLYDKPIAGIFSNRMSLVDETWKALEPQFISSEIIPIKKYHKGIKIQSGIHVKGNQIDLHAPKGESSVIDFIKDNKIFVRLRAQKFTLENDEFFARQSMFELYLKGDTISHPSIDFKFDLITQKMHAKTSDTQFGHSPFYNGLHELQIVADHLYWEKEKGNLIFQNNQTSRLVPVVYQSLRFFDKNWFLDLFNFDLQHPTTALLRLAKKYPNQREFYIHEIQEIYKFTDRAEVENLMVEFTNQGFVNFNPFEGKVYIQDRFFSFVTALNKDQDFDRIRFRSNVNNRPSGIIDLESGILTIQAVNKVRLNIKNDVTIYPEDKILHVYPNLDMEFDGSTMCGKFGFYGDNQKFDYDLYEVQFNEIDSFRYLLDIANPEDTGIYIHPCKTVLQEFTGILEIDHPDNKSSKRKTKAFPIIKSTEESYVYYDEVKGGLYPRDEFYFKADTFLLNTVLVQKTEELVFPGVLVSGGVFPDIRETLVLNKNEELGFVRDHNKNYELYDNAKFSSYLRLTNSGLMGKGQIIKDDLNLQCDSIDFYPTFLFANITDLANRTSRSNSPNISGQNVRLDWFVDEEWMEFKNLKKPFLFNNSSLVNGGFEYDLNNYTGYGTLIEKNVMVKSDSIHLEFDNWMASKSHMKVYPENVNSFYEHEIVLENTNIDLNYEYISQSLINVEDGNNHKFQSPFLKYNFTYPLFSYEMDNSEMFFETKDNDTKTHFLNITESLNPFTGNIKYISPTTIIEMKTFDVVLVDIEGVQIADALIRPASSELRLLSSGLPEKLTNAKIDLLNDKGDLSYTFQNAEVSIVSGDDYLAKADFVFSNRIGEEQIVRFDELAVNDNGNTYGSSTIEDNNDFNIDPNMTFLGDITLDPEIDRNMLLNGEIAYKDPCLNSTSDAFIYKDSLVDDIITIQNYDDKKLVEPKAAFVYNTSANSFKVDMANGNEKEGFVNLLELKGSLSYLDSTENYEIDFTDDEFSFARFTPNSCTYELEGFSNLSHHKLIPELSYSRFLFENDQPDSVVFQSHFGLNLALPSKALKVFRKDVAKKTKSNETTFEDSELYRNFLNNLIGSAATTKYFKAKRRGRNYIPTPMQTSLFFTDVDFVWNSTTNYFEHRGFLEINQIEGKKIDRIVDGYIKYRPGKKSDFWQIYIDLGDSDFYFFEISNDVIYTYSSSNKYVKTIQKKKKDISKKKSKLLVQLVPYIDQIPKKLD